MTRLPSKYLSSVLQILKEKVRKRQGSDRMKKVVDVVSQSVLEEDSFSGLVNNDW